MVTSPSVETHATFSKVVSPAGRHRDGTAAAAAPLLRFGLRCARAGWLPIAACVSCDAGVEREQRMGSVLPRAGDRRADGLRLRHLHHRARVRPAPKSVTPRERTSTREPQPQQKPTLRMRGIALKDVWWPRLRHHAREGRLRGLSLESETGPLIAVTAISVAVGYLIVTFA